MKYNMLTVTNDNAGINKHRKRLWTCKCDCGKTVTLLASLVKNGYQKSCGCLRRTLKTNLQHGHAGANGKITKVYKVWQGMHKRVRNPIGRNECYAGVEIDPAWDDFTQFLADMGEPAKGLQIDRIDSSKGYSKENCRWVSTTEQSRNRYCVKLYAHSGRGKTLHEWSEILEIPYGTLYHRLVTKEMTPEEAFAMPKNSKPERRDQMTITFNGETMTMKQWAAKLGISYGALYKRVITRKLPLEQALVTGNF